MASRELSEIVKLIDRLADKLCELSERSYLRCCGMLVKELVRLESWKVDPERPQRINKTVDLAYRTAAGENVRDSVESAWADWSQYSEDNPLMLNPTEIAARTLLQDIYVKDSVREAAESTAEAVASLNHASHAETVNMLNHFINLVEGYGGEQQMLPDMQ